MSHAPVLRNRYQIRLDSWLRESDDVVMNTQHLIRKWLAVASTVTLASGYVYVKAGGTLPGLPFNREPPRIEVSGEDFLQMAGSKSPVMVSPVPSGPEPSVNATVSTSQTTPQSTPLSAWKVPADDSMLPGSKSWGLLPAPIHYYVVPPKETPGSPPTQK